MYNCSFIFSNHFLLVRETSESIPGVLGMRQEHTLDGSPVHHRASYTHFLLNPFIPWHNFEAKAQRL